MSDRYSQLVNSPVAARRSPAASGCPSRSTLDRQSRASRSLPAAVLLRRRRPADGSRERVERRAGRPASAPPALERSGARHARKALVFDATGHPRLDRAGRAAALLPPHRAAASSARGRVVVLGTSAGEAGRRARRTRAARAGGLHPLARQGDRRAARPCSSCYVAAGRRGGSSTRRCASCSRRAPRTSPARCPGRRRGRRAPASTGTCRSTARSRWSPAPRAASARRSPRPWRRDGAEVVLRRRAALAGDLAAVANELAASDRARHHRRTTRRSRSPTSFAGGARHRRPQRRRHPRPHAREDARGPLAVADGDQPARSQERINDALLGRGCCDGRPDRLRLLDERHRRQPGQTNYATSKAGVIGMVDALAPELAERGRHDQRGRPGLHRDRR